MTVVSVHRLERLHEGLLHGVLRTLASEQRRAVAQQRTSIARHDRLERRLAPRAQQVDQPLVALRREQPRTRQPRGCEQVPWSHPSPEYEPPSAAGAGRRARAGGPPAVARARSRPRTGGVVPRARAGASRGAVVAGGGPRRVTRRVRAAAGARVRAGGGAIVAGRRLGVVVGIVPAVARAAVVVVVAMTSGTAVAARQRGLRGVRPGARLRPWAGVRARPARPPTPGSRAPRRTRVPGTPGAPRRPLSSLRSLRSLLGSGQHP